MQSTLFGGKYLVEGLIGQGGMGSVWRARNVMLDLPVALKLVHPEIRGKDTAARLLTEARVEANLHHPGVVRVFDYGETAGGDAYIVMELLEGANLADVLDTGPMPATQAVRLMLPVIHALHTAHRAGVVHRDLKPENIFLAQAGSHVQPKLLDFGIAKLRDDTCPRVTSNGSLLGSPAYMAPEQARGSDDVDQRTDVWAVCVVLYELISGQIAFDGDNQYAVLRAVIENELAPLKGGELDSLWPVLARGLSKDRRHRTPTAHALGVALARWLSAQGETEDACGEPLAWNWELNDALDQVEFAPTNPDRDAIRGRARRSPVRSGFRLRPPANSSWGMIARAAAVCAAAPAIALFVSQSMKDGPAVLGVAPRESAAIASGIGPVVKTDAPALGNPPLAAARREATLVAASAFAPQSLPAEASDDETPAAALTSQEAQVAGLAGTEAHSNLKAPAVKASKRSSASRAHESTKRSRAREAALGLKDPF